MSFRDTLVKSFSEGLSMDGPVMLDLRERCKISKGRNIIEDIIFERNLAFQIQMEGPILLIIVRAWIDA